MPPSATRATRRRRTPLTTRDRANNSRLFRVSHRAESAPQPDALGLSISGMEAARDAALLGMREDSRATAMLHAEAAETALLSAEDERALALRMRDATRTDAERAAARDHLIRANIRLVSQIARRYLGRGAPLDDLIQDGTIGLMRAIEKYSPERGLRLSTYATWWIRQAITRGLDNAGRTIRMPAYLTQRLRLLWQLRDELEMRHGATPTVEELAEASELTPEQVRDALAGHAITQVSLSLDMVMPLPHGGDPFTLGDMVEDPEALAAFEAVEEQVDRVAPDSLLVIMARLKRQPRRRDGYDTARMMEIVERRVLRTPPQPLDAIGLELHISRERVRQLEQRGYDLIRRERARIRQERQQTAQRAEQQTQQHIVRQNRQDQRGA